MWAKPLADGSIAVGLFNRGESSNPVMVNFKDIGLPNSAKVRFFGATRILAHLLQGIWQTFRVTVLFLSRSQRNDLCDIETTIRRSGSYRCSL